MIVEDSPLIGKLIELVSMPDDPDPIPVGTRGRVRHVVDLGFMFGEYGSVQIGVAWENGRSLLLTCPPDTYRVIWDAPDWPGPQ